MLLPEGCSDLLILLNREINKVFDLILTISSFQN